MTVHFLCVVYVILLSVNVFLPCLTASSNSFSSVSPPQLSFLPAGFSIPLPTASSAHSQLKVNSAAEDSHYRGFFQFLREFYDNQRKGFQFERGQACEHDAHLLCAAELKHCRGDYQCVVSCLTSKYSLLNSTTCRNVHPCKQDIETFCQKEVEEAHQAFKHAEIKISQLKEKQQLIQVDKMQKDLAKNHIMMCLRDHASSLSTSCLDHHPCLSVAAGALSKHDPRVKYAPSLSCDLIDVAAHSIHQPLMTDIASFLKQLQQDRQKEKEEKDREQQQSSSPAEPHKARLQSKKQHSHDGHDADDENDSDNDDSDDNASHIRLPTHQGKIHELRLARQFIEGPSKIIEGVEDKLANGDDIDIQHNNADDHHTKGHRHQTSTEVDEEEKRRIQADLQLPFLHLLVPEAFDDVATHPTHVKNPYQTHHGIPPAPYPLAAAAGAQSIEEIRQEQEIYRERLHMREEQKLKKKLALLERRLREVEVAEKRDHVELHLEKELIEQLKIQAKQAHEERKRQIETLRLERHSVERARSEMRRERVEMRKWKRQAEEKAAAFLKHQTHEHEHEHEHEHDNVDHSVSMIRTPPPPQERHHALDPHQRHREPQQDSNLLAHIHSAQLAPEPNKALMELNSPQTSHASTTHSHPAWVLIIGILLTLGALFTFASQYIA